MAEASEADNTRICPACLWENNSTHQYCVRCNAAMDAPVPAPSEAGTTLAGTSRTIRFVAALGVITLTGLGLGVRTVYRATQEVPPVSGDVLADGPRTVSAPPPVSGWAPGGAVPDEPAPAAWSSESFPVPVPAPLAAASSPAIAMKAPDVAMTSAAPPAAPVAVNPSDIPVDPAASMVGIAPRAPQERSAVARKRVFTEQDLLATRGEEKRVP